MEDTGNKFLESVLLSSSSKLAHVTQNAECFKFQVLVSYLSNDSSRPILIRHGYRVDHEYFYPASSIKLCGVVASLFKLQYLKECLGMKITLNTPLAFYPLREGEPYVDNDPSNLLDGTITLANEIRKIFLVSDNVAFNRLYAFAGQQYINEKMWDLGLCSTRIRHRLSVPMSQEENGYCEPIEISVPGCPVTLAPKHNTELIQCFEGDCKPLSLGVKHVLENGELVLNPMDFTMKNCISLMDLQNLMVKLFCPDVEQSGEPCKMPYSYQMLLQEAMADYPSESSNPVYHKEEFPDDYCKLFLPGVCRVRPKKSIRIYNKIGRAYGFTIENSYIFDKEKGEGFFLSAVIYTNSNGILNDDKYEYETIADHVMADLGETMARLVWKISPSSDAEVPLCLDCIPSSSWDAMKLVDTKGIYATEDKTSVSSDEAIHSNKSMDAKFLSNVSEGTVSQWLYDSMDQKVPVSGVQLQLQAIKLCYKYFSSI